MQLCIRSIYKHFDKKIVLNHTSAVFQEGSIYSVLGRNGAGKTTLFSCISGDLFFEDGEVLLEENGVSRPLTFEDVGIVSASPVLPDFLTGYEFIHFFVKLNREKDPEESIDSYFDLVHMEAEDRHKLIKNYSYGMKNKLQLLCCLIRNPKVILLDEPLYGDNISEKCGKGRDWRGQVWKRPDFRRVCGGTAPEQGRDVAVILRKTASAAVGAFFAPRKAPGGPTNGVAGNDAQTYESPQKRRRQAISGGLWYKMSRMASSRKSQQQTLEDEPPGP